MKDTHALVSLIIYRYDYNLHLECPHLHHRPPVLCDQNFGEQTLFKCILLTPHHRPPLLYGHRFIPQGWPHKRETTVQLFRVIFQVVSLKMAQSFQCELFNIFKL